MKVQSIIWLLMVSVCFAQSKDRAAVKRPDYRDVISSVPISKAKSMDGYLDLELVEEDQTMLPTIAILRNPFNETLRVFVTRGMPVVGVGQALKIEYYDQRLNAWRTSEIPMGSAAHKHVDLDKGQALRLKLGEQFWRFATSTIKKMDIPQQVKMRLIYRTGNGVELRSKPFTWNKK